MFIYLLFLDLTHKFFLTLFLFTDNAYGKPYDLKWNENYKIHFFVSHSISSFKGTSKNNKNDQRKSALSAFFSVLLNKKIVFRSLLN